ncbi:IclR family transcriptional regulator [Cellulomonas chengniuliangii]|uniref:IclR family transcriptional regulator n=1 Tax=Cellulomonas chengniuliangii TaxID=2968084 RepID=UPI001D0F3B40|nr:IclR family transcriptional regulator [Cellulomonas chengniuliangii]MCC2317075.1 IclR family transcriptional regulator [Cellulomonas chengniuliangii]
MAPTSDSGRSPAPAVTRAAAILILLAERGQPVGLADIARALGVAKSSTLNLCLALEQADLVRKTEQGYALGRATVRLGGAFVREFDVVREFYRVCAEAPALQNELLQIAMLDGTDVLYLARHEGRAPLRLSASIGDRFPAAITAVGCALLADLDMDEVRRRFADPAALPRWTDRSVATVDRLTAKLEATRARGYALDDGETHPGIVGIAVAIPPRTSADQQLAIGVSLMTTPSDADREHVVAALLDARAALTAPQLRTGPASSS